MTSFPPPPPPPPAGDGGDFDLADALDDPGEHRAPSTQHPGLGVGGGVTRVLSARLLFFSFLFPRTHEEARRG